MRNEKGQFVKGHKQLNTGRTWLKKGIALRKGEHHTEESKEKMSIAKKGKMPSNIDFIRNYKPPKGEKNPNWKGGKTDESKLARCQIQYRLWRESVFARDNWTCQKCKVKGGRLHPHHIRSFKQFVELRYAIDNGITFCENHHKEFHKIYGKKNINQEQINGYIKIIQ